MAWASPLMIHMLCLLTAMLRRLQVGPCGGDRANVAATAGALRVKHLPPLRLDLACPPGYPATDPPCAALAAPWLGAAQSANLEAALAELWEQQGPGNPVGFTWASWLAAEALDHIGASGVLILPAPGDDPGLDPSPAGSAQTSGASPARPLPPLARDNCGSSSSAVSCSGNARGAAGACSNDSSSGSTSNASGSGGGASSMALLRGAQPAAGDDDSSGALSAVATGGGPASGGEPAVQVPAAHGPEPACAAHHHADRQGRADAAQGAVGTGQPPATPGAGSRQARCGAGAQHRHRRRGGARGCGAAVEGAGPGTPAGPRQRVAASQPGGGPGASTGAAPAADVFVQNPRSAGLRIDAPAFAPRGQAVASPAGSAPRRSSGSRATCSAEGTAGAPLLERALHDSAASAVRERSAAELRPGATPASGAAPAITAPSSANSHQAPRGPSGAGADGAANGAADHGLVGTPASAPRGGPARSQASSEKGAIEAAQADSTEDVILALLKYSAAREYQLWQEVRGVGVSALAWRHGLVVCKRAHQETEPGRHVAVCCTAVLTRVKVHD